MNNPLTRTITDHEYQNLIIKILLIILSMIIIRTAWLSDDSYITMRTVLNFINGFGPVYNIGERVQAYTHPLWFMLLSIFSFSIGNIFYSAFILSILCSMAAAYLLIRYISLSFYWSIICALTLISSVAFTDYSTSGLENPLAYLLITITSICFLREMQSSLLYLIRLSICCSCVYLTRADLLIIVAPLLTIACIQIKQLKIIIPGLFLGFSPVLIWTFFTLIYYGFPFPNTAYAKLAVGIEQTEIISQGFHYFMDSLHNDPLTLIIIILAILLARSNKDTLSKMLGLGVSLYLIYILMIGGDFMSGRFFAVPLFTAMLITSRLPAIKAQHMYPIALVVILIGLCASFVPILNKIDFEEQPVNSHGIANERSFYYQTRGLITGDRRRFKQPQWPDAQTDESSKTKGVKVLCGGVGRFGIENPRIHIIDSCALTDPFLARMPANVDKGWRSGHLFRHVNKDYKKTIESGQNTFQNKNIASYYQQLSKIINDDVFSLDRFDTIISMNMGKYNHLTADYGTEINNIVSSKSNVNTKKAPYQARKFKHSPPKNSSTKEISSSTLEQYRTTIQQLKPIIFTKSLQLNYNTVQTKVDKIELLIAQDKSLQLDFYNYNMNDKVGSFRLKSGDFNQTHHLNSGLYEIKKSLPESISKTGFSALKITVIDGENEHSLHRLRLFW